MFIAPRHCLSRAEMLDQISLAEEEWRRVELARTGKGYENTFILSPTCFQFVQPNGTRNIQSTNGLYMSISNGMDAGYHLSLFRSWLKTIQGIINTITSVCEMTFPNMGFGSFALNTTQGNTLKLTEVKKKALCKTFSRGHNLSISVSKQAVDDPRSLV
ncbi:hypothetical protein ACFE04_011344 [Oxalis oulophora]